MGAVETLLSQYSIESIIFFLILIVAAFKIISELWDWCYTKLTTYFDVKTKQKQQELKTEEWKKHIDDKISSINAEMEKGFSNIDDCISMLEEQQRRMTDRLQENTRSFIIDKHHYYCYQIKAIDDMNLQSLERRYMYYKQDGGDSFIDRLMEDIRELPRVNLEHKYREIERGAIM